MKNFFTLQGEWFSLLARSFREIFRGQWTWKAVVQQIIFIGNKSFPLILITALSSGLVMTLQFGIGLAKFGGKLYIPKVVSLSILREMSPVFAGLMMAARVGAGIAAEVGSMSVTQQVDALRALGASPLSWIVVPRLIACMICLPILVMLSNIMGIIGGMIMAYTELQMDPSFYLLKILTTVTVSDILSGVGKAFFFSIFIAITACFYGFKATSGTEAVGRVTTQAVVASSVFIFLGDFFLTKLFWILG